jgi:valyl-tRNA synthetase
MMMLGIHLAGDVPFRTVYLSGLIRDPEGQKMSKTRGNVVDPLGVIDETGADALRFALIHGATPGLDQRFGQAKLDNARNFANKLWNATRFVVGARPPTIDPSASRRTPNPAALGPTEHWIQSRLAATTAAADQALAELNLGELTRLIYDAIWNEFCDWGLELAKVRLGDTALSVEQREATWWTLVGALDGYLRLLHPVMPFVTEALWAVLPHAPDDPELLIVARWPASTTVDAMLEAEVASFIELIRGIRNARAEAHVEPGAWLPVQIAIPGPADNFDALRPALERLARARPMTRLTEQSMFDGGTNEGRLLVVTPGAEAVVLLPGADRDGAADRARLERELTDAERLLAAARDRLANQSFLDRAPPTIVDGARASEAELAATVQRLRERLGR